MAAEGDVDLLVQKIFFPGIRQGVFIDVGAAQPEFLSVSASFRKLGWKIIAIEPNPDFCAAHRAKGYEVLQYACSDENKDDAEFFVVDSKGIEYRGGDVSFESFSSLGMNKDFQEHFETVKDTRDIKKISVKVRTLDAILSEHEPNLERVDVIAADVEGWELSVLRGFSLDKFRPKVAILENLFNDKSYDRFMSEHGYQLWITLEPNQVYVRSDALNLIERARIFVRSLLWKFRR